MKDNVSRAYRYKPHPETHSFGTTMYNSMNGNPLFASLKPMVDDFKVSNDAFGIAIANALIGGKPSTIIKKECYDVVIDKMDDIAVEVNKLAKGDEKIIMAAGFEVKSTSTRSVDYLETPTGLKADDVKGRKGFIKVGWDKDPDSVNTAIEYQVQGEADAPWQNGTYSTASSSLVSGLPSGKYVAVRIYSMGRKGLKSDTTEPVTVLVS